MTVKGLTGMGIVHPGTVRVQEMIRAMVVVEVVTAAIPGTMAAPGLEEEVKGEGRGVHSSQLTVHS